MKVAVLGCGPAGMFAAHAAIQEGHTVRIFSNPRKSFMRGAQYLHRPIPGLSGDPFRIYYGLTGDVDGYRSKIYGSSSEVEVSPETLVGVSDAWDIREAYDAAWDKYNNLVLPWDANNDWIPETFDLVFSTIPAKLLCKYQDHSEILQDKHEGISRCNFRSEMVYSTAKADEFIGDDDNTVMCSGDDAHAWYRTARIHGWETTEFPFDRRGSYAAARGNEGQVWSVEKPVSNSCQCHPEIIRSGRYGKWTKGVLSHESYTDMKEALKR